MEHINYFLPSDLQTSSTVIINSDILPGEKALQKLLDPHLDAILEAHRLPEGVPPDFNAYRDRFMDSSIVSMGMTSSIVTVEDQSDVRYLVPRIIFCLMQHLTHANRYNLASLPFQVFMDDVEKVYKASGKELYALVDGLCKDWPKPPIFGEGIDTGFETVHRLWLLLKPDVSIDDVQEFFQDLGREDPSIDARLVGLEKLDMEDPNALREAKAILLRALVSRLSYNPEAGFQTMIKPLQAIQEQFKGREDVVYIWIGYDNVSGAKVDNI